MFKFFFGIFLFLDASLYADSDSSGYDVTAKMGGLLGTVTVTNPPEGQTKAQTTGVSFGGILMAVGKNGDFTDNTSYIAQIALLVDWTNNQISQEAVEFGTAYHILGGVRKKVINDEKTFVTSTNNFNFSWLTRASLANYTLTTIDRQAPTITGSVLALKVGFEYRKEVKKNLDLVGEMLFSPLSFPTTATRLSPQTTEFSFGVRGDL